MTLGAHGRPLLVVALATLMLGTLPSFAPGEIAQNGDLRISLDGGVIPERLPRTELAPVRVEVGGDFSTTDGAEPPQLRDLTIEIARGGRLFDRGLPTCPASRIEFTTADGALENCGTALVGSGHAVVRLHLPQQAAFPYDVRFLIFNGRRQHGHRVILVHASSPPVSSFVVPFTVHRTSGVFGLKMTADMPRIDAAYVVGFAMNIGRRFTYRGKRRSYLNASCPAPRGFPAAVFPLARVTGRFADGRTLTTTMVRKCEAHN